MKPQLSLLIVSTHLAFQTLVLQSWPSPSWCKCASKVPPTCPTLRNVSNNRLSVEITTSLNINYIDYKETAQETMCLIII